MSASSAQILSQGAGWAVVISFGIGFSVLMLAISYLQEKYTTFSLKSNEEFNSASRSVKPGLIASAIVSAWTWSATLLQSSAVGFRYGISGPYWYAAGATVQVLLFAMMASKTKLNAPFAHTYLQIIKARWGTTLHVIHLCFAIATNILVGTMLILGGSATVTQLTGMNTIAAIFLTPISVAIYTLVGGLRATFLADYSHTAVMMAIILAFAFTVYASSPKIGSPDAMYRLLEAATPVEGNAGGSYLTMRSLPGLRFGVINICGNFATVFADQSYHQRGIASSPTVAARGFIMGGLAWFAVPMVMASSLGLAARALIGRDPDMASLSTSEISAGLPAPAAAAALLGQSGAATMLIVLYLAVTSAASAQLIAVSSVLTFDVWKTYIRPNASAREIYHVSHAGVALWSVALGVLGLIFFYAGIGMGWLYVFLGVVVCPAVFPTFACLTWKKANKNGALVGMPLGLVLGVMTWLVMSNAEGGSLTIETTNLDEPLVAGNLISLLVPTVVTIVWSLISPDNYTFEGTRAVNAPSEDEPLKEVQAKTQPIPIGDTSEKDSQNDTESKDETNDGQVTSLEKGLADKTGVHAGALATDIDDEMREVRRAGLDPVELQKSVRMAQRVAIPLTFILIIFVPAMAVIPRTFTPAGLAAWVSIIIFWMFISSFLVILLPVYESRESLKLIFKGMWKSVTGRKEVAAASA